MAESKAVPDAVVVEASLGDMECISVVSALEKWRLNLDLKNIHEVI